MVYFRWFGVLNINRYIALTTAVNLTTRGSNMHTIRHFIAGELANQFIHHGFYNPRRIGSGDVTVQPALRVRNHGDRVMRATDNKLT